MRLFFWVLFSLLFTSSSLAQVYKFGDVPIEQLEMEVYELDSSASAVVLFDQGETLIDYYNDEWNVKFKRHIRIKILTDEGLEYGDIAIRHRKVEPKQSVSRVKATTYNLTPNGKIDKTNLGRREKHTEKISDVWSDLKFTLPNLRKGSVFEYSYELHSNDPMDFPDWFFQREIPTVWSGYVAQIPEWFNYETVRRGFHYYSKFDQKTYQDRIIFGQGASSYTYDFEGTEYDFAMQDIPALTSEPHMKASIDYLAHMRFQLSTIEMPGSTKQYFMGTWPAVKDRLLEDRDLGKRLRNSDKIDELLAEVSLSDSSSFDDMVKIYNLVSSKIEWNEYVGIYAFDGLDKVLEDSVGNGASINLLLIQALRQAGFEAHPLVISTRSNGEIINNLPVISSFNHTLAYVKVGDIYHILDAKNDKRPYNILPASNLNGDGLLIKEGSVAWVPIESNSRNNVTKFITMEMDEQGFRGDIQSKYHGIFAMDIREEFEEKDSVQAVLNREYSIPGESELDLVELNDKFDEGLFEYTSSFNSNWDAANTAVIYFNPIITEKYDSNPFKLEERSYPIDFDYPFDKNVIINITVPEGWVVDEAPESVLHRLPQRAGEFRRIIQLDGNKIVVNYRLRINKERFMPDEYDLIKEMYDKLVTSLSENIVLKKGV